MTTFYVVLADIFGETIPIAVFPNAVAMRDGMAHRAATPESRVGDYRVNFRVAEAPFVDVEAEADEILRKSEGRLARRGMQLKDS